MITDKMINDAADVLEMLDGSDYDVTAKGALEAVFESMSAEQLREFASGLITEANQREGYGE